MKKFSHALSKLLDEKRDKRASLHNIAVQHRQSYPAFLTSAG
ncbi:MAG TPA: hypothetical protein PLN69_01860 [bacterium]|nr:hypothetical protein [bacterium]